MPSGWEKGRIPSFLCKLDNTIIAPYIVLVERISATLLWWFFFQDFLNKMRQRQFDFHYGVMILFLSPFLGMFLIIIWQNVSNAQCLNIFCTWNLAAVSVCHLFCIDHMPQKPHSIARPQQFIYDPRKLCSFQKYFCVIVVLFPFVVKSPCTFNIGLGLLLGGRAMRGRGETARQYVKW